MNTPLDTQPGERDDRWLEERFRAAAAATITAESHPEDTLDSRHQLVGRRATGQDGHARHWTLAAAAAAVVALIGALIAVGDQTQDNSGPAAANAPNLVVQPSPLPGSESATDAPVSDSPALAVVAPTAPATTSSAPAPTTAAVSAAPVAYRLADIDPLPTCPTDTNGETVGKWDDGATEGVWYVQPDGTCIAVEVDWADSIPSDAAPVDVPNYPDLFATASGGMQTIYARVMPGANSYHPDGGWVVMTALADVPTADVVRLIIVPSN